MKPFTFYIVFLFFSLYTQAQKKSYSLQQLKGTWISDSGDSIVIGDTSHHPVNGYLKAGYNIKECAYINVKGHIIDVHFGKNLNIKPQDWSWYRIFNERSVDSFRYSFNIIYASDSFLWIYTPDDWRYFENNEQFISAKYRAAVPKIKLVLRDTSIKFDKFIYTSSGMIGSNGLEIYSDRRIKYIDNRFSRKDSLQDSVSQGCLDTLLYYLQTVDLSRNRLMNHITDDEGSEGVSITYHGKTTRFTITHLDGPDTWKFRTFIEKLRKREETKLISMLQYYRSGLVVKLDRPHWWQFRKMRKFKRLVSINQK